MKRVKFPELARAENTEEKLKLITEYLWQLQNELYHELSNLSPENFNEKTIKEMADAISSAVGTEVNNETS